MKHTIFFFSLLLGLSYCNSHSAEEQATVQNSGILTSNNPLAQPTPRIFDVPALLGKNIDQIEDALGKPSEPDTPNLTIHELERRYYKKGYTLEIIYDTISRAITGFLIPATEHSGGTKSCRKLLIAGNLKRDDPRYTVDSLEMDKAGYFGSIVISSNDK